MRALLANWFNGLFYRWNHFAYMQGYSAGYNQGHFDGWAQAKNEDDEILDGWPDFNGDDGRKCRVCGCTHFNACMHDKLGTCWWVRSRPVLSLRPEGAAMSEWRMRAQQLIASLVADLPDDATLAQTQKGVVGQGLPCPRQYQLGQEDVGFGGAQAPGALWHARQTGHLLPALQPYHGQKRDGQAVFGATLIVRGAAMMVSQQQIDVLNMVNKDGDIFDNRLTLTLICLMDRKLVERPLGSLAYNLTAYGHSILSLHGGDHD